MYRYTARYAEFSELAGKTLAAIDRDGEDGGDDRLTFRCDDGTVFQMDHVSDCCECVDIEDIEGDLADLIGSPITLAEEVTHENETPEGMPAHGSESFTWTFYRVATAKGFVTIRWYGSSNGYYSESVSFRVVED